MANRTRKEKQAERRAQRLRREALKVRRVEVALSANNGRDVHIADGLSELKNITISDYVRQALVEKMVFDGTSRREQPRESASEQLDALYTELNAQREAMVQEFATTPTIDYFEDRFNRIEQQNERLIAMVDNLTRLVVELSERETVVETVTATRVRTQVPDDSSGVVQSSGLNMSRPRPRPKAKVISAPVQTQEPEELNEEQKIELAKVMARSIKNAQPGRSTGD